MYENVVSVVFVKGGAVRAGVDCTSPNLCKYESLSVRWSVCNAFVKMHEIASPSYFVHKCLLQSEVYL